MKLPESRVPLKITPCPINEAVVELRFSAAIPEDAVFGLVYNKFKKDFPNLNKLPILEFPQSFRDQEDLRFQPHYRLSDGGFILQVGPKSISVVCQKEYQGWLKFKDKVMKVFNGCQELGLFKETLRLGIRYINLFPADNIFDETKIDVALTGSNIAEHQNVLRTEFNFEQYTIILHAINCAKLQKDEKGSILDIDLVTTRADITTNLEKIIDEAHGFEKRLFFSLLNDDFLQKFNPQYGKKL